MSTIKLLRQRITGLLVLILVCGLPTWTLAQVLQNGDATVPQEKTADQKKPDASPQKGGMEILSDTQGVDFRPYLKRLRFTVQNHWELLMPAIALPPLKKSGTVVIEFAINRDGKVSGMKLTKSSDDITLDRAAWGAILDSIPLPLLPAEFKGDFLKMRSTFVYNPAPSTEIHPIPPAYNQPATSAEPRPVPQTPSIPQTSKQQKPPLAITTTGKVEYISDHAGLDETYTKTVLSKVQSSLQNLLRTIPAGSIKTSGPVAFTFSILRNGAVKDIKLKQSSGSKPFDLKVWEAVESSLPYQDLPQQFKNTRLKVRCEIGVP
ncbi:MAG TPA: TonB family protein [Candidatus Angelobacter sp.]|jgi:TonB family protein